MHESSDHHKIVTIGSREIIKTPVCMKFKGDSNDINRKFTEKTHNFIWRVFLPSSTLFHIISCTPPKTFIIGPRKMTNILVCRKLNTESNNYNRITMKSTEKCTKVFAANFMPNL